jgi:hypothetical protein
MGEDVSFLARKGVVNTIGGAKDITRHKDDPEPLRKSDRLQSGGIHMLSSLPSTGSKGSVRGASAPSDSVGRSGIHTFKTLEHDSKVGLRKGDGLGGGAGASVTTAPGAKLGDLGGIRMEAPKKAAIKASKVVTTDGGGARARGGSAGATSGSATAAASSVERGPPIIRTLGGGGGGGGGDARSDREKRLAYFERMKGGGGGGGGAGDSAAGAGDA